MKGKMHRKLTAMVVALAMVVSSLPAGKGLGGLFEGLFDRTAQTVRADDAYTASFHSDVLKCRDDEEYGWISISFLTANGDADTVTSEPGSEVTIRMKIAAGYCGYNGLEEGITIVDGLVGIYEKDNTQYCPEITRGEVDSDGYRHYTFEMPDADVTIMGMFHYRNYDLVFSEGFDPAVNGHGQFRFEINGDKDNYKTSLPISVQYGDTICIYNSIDENMLGGAQEYFIVSGMSYTYEGAQQPVEIDFDSEYNSLFTGTITVPDVEADTLILNVEYTPAYRVTLQNYDVMLDKFVALEGDVVTIVPNDGYVVQSVTVMSGETAVATSQNSEGNYCFVMPAGPVTVDAETVLPAFGELGTCNGYPAYNLLSRTYTLVSDTTISAGFLHIPEGKTVTLDLNGYTLDRGLGSATAGREDGYVIFNEGTLTIIDSSNAKPKGLITGGYGVNGGAIYNAGTLTIEDGRIKNNKASGKGGGIYNAGTLSMSGGTIQDNDAGSAGGGVYNSGTINVSGKASIRFNTVSKADNNIFLSGNTVLNITDTLNNNYAVFGISGDNLPRTVTSGWGTYKGNCNYKDTILSDGTYSVRVENSEIKFTTLYYIDREFGDTAKDIPSDAKRFTGTLDNGWYYVDSNITVDNRIYVENGKKVYLVLCDGATLTLKKGLGVKPYLDDNRPEGELYIFGQTNDSGRLVATGDDGAGIGGDDEWGNGYIEIHGGKIEATGDKYDAGIGTGDEPVGWRSHIRIYGGDITAQGGTDAAGIGGGNEGKAPRVIIYGGTVKATGGSYGSGIGGGELYGTYGVDIYGGIVTAKGGSRAAGIGGGRAGPQDGKVYITGGTVTAVGGSGGAGIGGGYMYETWALLDFESYNSGDGGEVEITGGTVYAEGGEADEKAGAGIGGGNASKGGSVKISGGTVTAVGGYYAKAEQNPSQTTSGSIEAAGAGIGGGHAGEGGSLTITGGTLIASTNGRAQAIGRGATRSVISDGSINLGSTMKVTSKKGTAPAANRAAYCFDLDSSNRGVIGEKSVTITRCDHSGSKLYTVLSDSQHKETCKYCLYSEVCDHEGQTCVCGYEQSNYTVSFSGGVAASDLIVAAGQEITMPSEGTADGLGRYIIADNGLPTGYFILEGWTDDADTSVPKHVYEIGDSVTVNGNMSFTAVTTPVFKVNVSDTIANGRVSANVEYARAGEEIVLSVIPSNGYQIGKVSYVETALIGNSLEFPEITVLPDDSGNYTFTVTCDDNDRVFDITVQVLFEKQSMVKYIDEHGEEKTEYATSITSETTELTPGWHVVDSSLVLAGLTYSGEVHLILADGCGLYISAGGLTCTDQDSTLSIYGQKYGSGTIYAGTPGNGSVSSTDPDSGNYSGTQTGTDLYVPLIAAYGNLNFYGGRIHAANEGGNCYVAVNGDMLIVRGELNLRLNTDDSSDSNCALLCSGDLTITGGQLTAKGMGRLDINVGNGEIKVTGGNVYLPKHLMCNNLKIGLTSGSDSFEAGYIETSEQSAAGVFIVDLTVPCKDDEGTIYAIGEHGSDELNGKRLTIGEPVPTFMKQSLLLSGQIGVNFYLDLPEIEGVDYTTSYMTFEVPGRGNSLITTRADYDSSNMNATRQYYGFTCFVSAIQMADTITATFHYQEGTEEKTVTKEYSVQTYFRDFHARLAVEPNAFDSSTIGLVRALADYGHYVQIFLDKNNDNWSVADGDYAEITTFYTRSSDFNMSAVASGVSGKALSYTTDIAPEIKDVTFAVALTSSPTINVYFTMEDGYEGEFLANGGANKPLTVKPLSNNRYMVKIEGLNAVNLGKTYTINVFTGSNVTTLEVSALSYVKSVLEYYADDSDALYAAAAIYNYWKAADGYYREH
ncbi:MAG: hypothetical protein J5379_00110 [Clostridiales bacterium]|nr:hypothetical protein [Clostridiales bacterium]